MPRPRRPVASIDAIPEQLLHQLDWKVARRLTGTRSGSYRTNLRGTGIDVTDIRPYEPYDDVRHIDWNVTARLDEPHVREFAEDRDLTAWLLVDRSGSMTFGPAEHSKDMVVIELAVALARMLARGGNRVGAILYDQGIDEVIPPAASRSHVLRIADRLLVEPEHARAETDLSPLLRSADTMLRRRSLVFLISDLIGADGWHEPLGVLAQRHEVAVIRVGDARESDLPDVGSLWVEDAETGEQLLVDTSDPVFRARYAEAAADREARIDAQVLAAGARLYTVWTDDDLVEALVRMARTPRLVR